MNEEFVLIKIVISNSIKGHGTRLVYYYSPIILLALKLLYQWQSSFFIWYSKAHLRFHGKVLKNILTSFIHGR